MRFRSFMVAIALVLSAAACSDDDTSDLCPAPTPTITAPDGARPDLSLVPECKRPDGEMTTAAQGR